jgi:uracil phosphoribosyltransferase
MGRSEPIQCQFLRALEDALQKRGFLINILTVGQLAGVSILRAGETMEQALREVSKDVSIGKILIQTNLDTGEPEVNNDAIVFLLIVLSPLSLLFE